MQQPKRYQAVLNMTARAWYVRDNWGDKPVIKPDGSRYYQSKEQAQARARTLNSRNGGK